MTEPVKKLLKKVRIDDALILAGWAKYVQTPDVIRNKTFTSCIMELLASEVYYYTEAGNLKPASYHLTVTWILEEWTQLDKELIIRSCALTLKNDGSEHNSIHCFKSGQPCLRGASLLKDQVSILSNDHIVNCNGFEVTDSDVDEVNTETIIIDESDD